MTGTLLGNEADRALKARHRSIWAAGDYPALASALIPELGRRLVEACRIRPGDRVLDVAAGSGNAAVPGALAGGRVVAADLTPELLDAGRKSATDKGIELEWRQADAEALPFADGSFDVVMSCVGVMFAPHHEAAARELIRVCRRGGTLGLLNWTAGGFIGRLMAAMRPYAPPLPPGVQPPTLWGREEYLRELLADEVGDAEIEQRELRVDHFATPAAFRDAFKTLYGPTVAVYRHLADDPQRVAALDRDLEDLAAGHAVPGSPTFAMDWEYLLLTARRHG